MKIESLTLRNFRNVVTCTLNPQAQLNFLVGRNAQGKTTFIEAIGMLSNLRSFRSPKAQEVIRWGEVQAEIHARISHQDAQGSSWSTDLRVVLVLDPTTGRTQKLATINEKAFRSSSAYLEQKYRAVGQGFHAIVFNPADHELVRGEPRLRRDYLDRVVSSEDLDYLKDLRRYQRILEQRNSLLKDPRGSRTPLLDDFTLQLGEAGARLTAKRLTWLSRLEKRLGDILQKIAPIQRPLRVKYASDWVPDEARNLKNFEALTSPNFTGLPQQPSLELLNSVYEKKAAQMRAAELQSGTTLVGPHRDDWLLTLGDRALKGHGSQGEVRSALLALKIAEVELFQEATGLKPLFLLDDFSSELDGARRSFLLEFLSETELQVFVTTTEESVAAGRRFIVESGSLREEGRHEHGSGQAEIG